MNAAMAGVVAALAGVLMALAGGATAQEVVLPEEGKFWNERGKLSTWREAAGTAYCEAHDVMVAWGGFDKDDNLLSSIEVFDFQRRQGWELRSDDGPARALPNVVSVASDPVMPDSCRFLLFGGTKHKYTEKLEDDKVGSGPEVWALTVTLDSDGNLESNITDVELSYENEAAEAAVKHGIFGAGAVGFKDAMFVLGGYANPGGTTQDLDSATQVMRFKVEDLDDGTTAGTWAVVDVLDQRLFMFGHATEDSRWVIFGGRSYITTSRGKISRLITSETRMFDLNSLYSAKAIGAPPPRVSEFDQDLETYQEDYVFRMHHVAAMHRGYMFVYGGERIDRQSMVYAADAVVLSSIGKEVLTCELPNGDITSWCSFKEEFPGSDSRLTAVQRRDSLVALVSGLSEVRLEELNLTNVLSQGRESFNSAHELEYPDDSFFGRTERTLQYSLIAVCIFLCLSVAVLFHQREGAIEFQVPEGSKSRPKGLSLETVQTLQYVTFREDGKHFLVEVEHDDEGEPTITRELGPRPGKAPNVAAEAAPKAESNPGVAKVADAPADEEEQVGEGVNVDGGEKVAEPDAPAPSAGASYLDSDEGELCAICLLEFEEGELLQELQCGHLFHWDCVRTWLLKNGTCPSCRTHAITGDNEDDASPAREVEGEESGLSDDDGDNIAAEAAAEAAVDLEMGRRSAMPTSLASEATNPMHEPSAAAAPQNAQPAPARALLGAIGSSVRQLGLRSPRRGNQRGAEQSNSRALSDSTVSFSRMWGSLRGRSRSAELAASGALAQQQQQEHREQQERQRQGEADERRQSF